MILGNNLQFRKRKFFNEIRKMDLKEKLKSNYMQAFNKYISHSHYIRKLLNDLEQKISTNGEVEKKKLILKKKKILEILLKEERIGFDKRGDFIKMFSKVSILSERSDLISPNYNLLDAVIIEKLWIIKPKNLKKLIEKYKKRRGKKFTVELYFNNNTFQYAFPTFRAKDISPKKVFKELGSTM